jgi:hypothetical protein
MLADLVELIETCMPYSALLLHLAGYDYAAADYYLASSGM